MDGEGRGGWQTHAHELEHKAAVARGQRDAVERQRLARFDCVDWGRANRRVHVPHIAFPAVRHDQHT